MNGHIVLVLQNAHRDEQWVQNLATEGFCSLCFSSIEQAAASLADPNCRAQVLVVDVAMRRASDYAVLLELGTLRPDLHTLIFGVEQNAMLDGLSSSNLRVSVFDRPISDVASKEAVKRALIEAVSQAGPTGKEPKTAPPSTFLPYSEEFLRRVGMAEVPVLLSGETGVGKEVMARRLCSYSHRADKPFLKLNCAALPPELAESELFGCVKGAFTGANADRQGRFEIAQGGTILLDEIGDMDLRLQTKLLQVLQDGEIQPLGSTRTLRVNVWVMAATHRDLTKAIQEGTFREDLYYRLNVIKIVIPPLRERQEEIIPLAEMLLARHTPKGQQPPAIREQLKRFLLSYHWPGNVRELENVMRRFLVYQDSPMLIQELMEGTEEGQPLASRTRVSTFDGSSGVVAGASQSADPNEMTRTKAPGWVDRAGQPDRLDRLTEASRQAETELLLDALDATRWNRRQAAAALEIDYKAFLYKLQKYGIVESKAKRRDLSA